MKKQFSKVEIKVYHNEIHFPKGYYFSQSNIAKSKKISAAEINEINLNTFPISLVIQHSEVIFLKNEFIKEIENFAKLNQIPIIERVDIWELLNEPFLDTEFEDAYKTKSIAILEDNGLTKNEINEIRSKIGKTMWKNFFAWEWVYLGLYDFLAWIIFLNKKKYNWAMKIALRNYEKK